MDIFGGITRFAGDVWKKGEELGRNLTNMVSGGEPDISTPAVPMGPGGHSDGSGLGQAQQIQSTIKPSFEATKDTVSMAEGTFDHDAGRPDYSVRFSEDVGGGSLDVAKPHPNDARPSRYSSRTSAASGAYQFMPDTWARVNDGNVPMTPENQDSSFQTLLDERGFDLDKPFREEAHKIAPEWASVPMRNGQSRYNQPVKSIDTLDSFHQDRMAHHQDRARQDVYRQREEGFATPPTEAPAPAAESVVAPPRVREEEYAVQGGDTAYGLARKHGMSVDELASLNNLDDASRIRVGQKLRFR